MFGARLHGDTEFRTKLWSEGGFGWWKLAAAADAPGTCADDARTYGHGHRYGHERAGRYDSEPAHGH